MAIEHPFPFKVLEDRVQVVSGRPGVWTVSGARRTHKVVRAIAVVQAHKAPFDSISMAKLILSHQILAAWGSSR